MTCPPVRGLAVVEARAHRVVSGSVVQTVTGRRHIEVLDQTGRFGEAGSSTGAASGTQCPLADFEATVLPTTGGPLAAEQARPQLLARDFCVKSGASTKPVSRRAVTMTDVAARPVGATDSSIISGGGGAVSGQEARLVSLPAPRTRSGSVLSSALPGFLNSCSEAQFRTTKCMQVTTLAETCAHHPERVGRRPRPPELRQTVWSGPVKRREPHHRPHSVTTASQDWNLPRIPVWRKAVVEAAAGTAGGKGSGGQAGLQQAGLRAEGAEVPATGGGGAPAVGV